MRAHTDPPLHGGSGSHPSVAWDSVGVLLLSKPGALQCSRSEMVMLEVATSLVSRRAVQLGAVVQAVDESELRLILRALEEAAYGDAG
ncbi:hypothetical protein [Streptomyces sp. NPDC095613]|uniref:hypothetical protein n=1 Tax=Streptomyces sp. NPDC095613 TaxID=3155540 RepID=UPI003334994B